MKSCDPNPSPSEDGSFNGHIANCAHFKNADGSPEGWSCFDC